MKKTIAFVLVLSMILGLAACGAVQEAKNSKSLYAHGLDIVHMLSELTQSERFVGIYTANNEITEMILNLGKYNYETPDTVLAITVPEETLNQMAELDSLENASEELKRYLKSRVQASLVSQINAMGGAVNLAASSVCTAGKTFVSENTTEDVIYLYTYKNAPPVAVTFTLGEDHTVSATGTFILYDGFTCGSAEELQSAFADIPVEIAVILPEK